jgi:hypothetical protein
MTSPRHLSLFLTLGLFWGVSPSLYQYWGLLGMPVSHVIVLTGIGVAAALALIEDSYGVAGLHLNGDVAPWHELRTGGRYEDWLFDFDQAVKRLPPNV